MPFSAKVVASACLVIHLAFFMIESVWFPGMSGKFMAAVPDGYVPIFNFSPKVDNALTLQIFAFNMGCYNLLLAAGVGYSLAVSSRFPNEARTLLSYICCVMIAAGIVLGVTASWLCYAALAQSGPAAICLALMRGRVVTS